MDTIAGNVLNANTTRKRAGRGGAISPQVLRCWRRGDGRDATVHRASTSARSPATRAPFGKRYEPGHPDADPATGLVQTPNVDIGTETVNMMEASRAYEANVSLMQTTKSMFQQRAADDRLSVS